MINIRIPTFNELLARISNPHQMSAPKLAAAVGAEEARDIFAQLSAQIVGKDTSATTK